jgi:hypothetical protein
MEQLQTRRREGNVLISERSDSGRKYRLKGILQALCHSRRKGVFRGAPWGKGFKAMLPSQQSVAALLRPGHWLPVTMSLCFKRISNVNSKSVMFYEIHSGMSS